VSSGRRCLVFTSFSSEGLWTRYTITTLWESDASPLKSIIRCTPFECKHILSVFCGDGEISLHPLGRLFPAKTGRYAKGCWPVPAETGDSFAAGLLHGGTDRAGRAAPGLHRVLLALPGVRGRSRKDGSGVDQGVQGYGGGTAATAGKTGSKATGPGRDFLKSLSLIPHLLDPSSSGGTIGPAFCCPIYIYSSGHN